jgi:uncharacterized protein
VKSLKTFNDPIYGFITIEDQLIFKLLEHPYFQRLRRISQLGLTNLVYSGANHSRFQHALGAMNLMKNAIAVLRSKDAQITETEEQAAKIAILLHDIGHGPFSHALENTIVKSVNHESIGLMVMKQLNDEFDGALTLAIQIYTNQYPVKFLHQLVSSQLDTDRLDYLKRDSFFTGVSEGVIGSERLVKMMTVHEDQLAIEAKGIYSLEKFLLARRLMYWQVYLHKTVLSAEFLLMNILLRAKDISSKNNEVNGLGTLNYFLKEGKNCTIENHATWLPHFMKLDDFDVMSAIKYWAESDNHVLKVMCDKLINRKLLKTRSLAAPLSKSELNLKREKLAEQLGWTVEEASYLLFQKSMTNKAYNAHDEKITVLFKDGTSQDISEASTIFRFSSLESEETKHFIYYPAEFNSQ